MGAGASLPLSPVRPGFSTMCISFHHTDRITVLHLDDAGLSVIRQAIDETWKAGIQCEQSKCGSGWSFKLSGTPFGVFVCRNTFLQGRKMVCRVLQRLYEIGWKIIACSNLGRAEKSTLFFKRSSPEFSTRPFVCVSLKNTDTLRFFNLPPQLIKAIKKVIQSCWSLGIQKEEMKDGIVELKLRGTPWHPSLKETTMANVLVQNITAILRQNQWAYYCNVRFNNLCDSLFFRYDPSIPPGESSPLCTIHFKRHDRLRVVSAPQDILTMIRKVIEANWAPGRIQNDQDYHGSWEFKLSGNPWFCTGQESTRARYLVMKILGGMQEHGWHNIAGINISQRITDKTVMIFQKGEPIHSPMMCLSLNEMDKFQLTCMPPQMIDLFKQMLLSRWSKGIQAEKQLTLGFGNVCEFKLSGWPWMGMDNNDTLHARSFLCNVLDEFGQRGWKPLSCAEVTARYYHNDNDGYYPADVHSFWFVYDPEAATQASTLVGGFNFASPLQQYDIGMPSQPASTGFQVYAFGMQPGPYSPSNIPPPSYGQAMEMNCF